MNLNVEPTNDYYGPVNGHTFNDLVQLLQELSVNGEMSRKNCNSDQLQFWYLAKKQLIERTLADVEYQLECC